jgi:hypothetical protein
MAQQSKESPCVQPAGGPIAPAAEPAQGDPDYSNFDKEVSMTIATVGKQAPDFQANGFLDGNFKSFKLSDYRGQWVSLCFYPGDFTFV